jgi:hypothetical protein
MTNVSIFGMTNVGCSLEPPTGKIIFAIRAYDLICDSSTNGNFYIGGAGKVTDVQLVNLRTSTTDGNNVYIDSGPTIDGVEFYGLSSTYADLHGIVVQNSGAINLKFLGGKSCNNSRAASNTYDDFVVATATQKFDIVDMALGPCDELGAGQSRYALSINAGADNFIARDNRLSGGLTANYNGPVASSSRLIDNLSY